MPSILLELSLRPLHPLQVFANESSAVIAGLSSLEDEGAAFFASETAGAAPSLETLQADLGIARSPLPLRSESGDELSSHIRLSLGTGLSLSLLWKASLRL